jgi:hypothetical protein
MPGPYDLVRVLGCPAIGGCGRAGEEKSEGGRESEY